MTAKPVALAHLSSAMHSMLEEAQLDLGDEWVLASNLQEAIRRGVVDVALAMTTKLNQVKEQYFWRRLVVIAYEDVGFGSFETCRQVLGLFRRSPLRRKIGRARLACYLARRLCEAPKGRAPYNAIAALDFFPTCRHAKHNVRSFPTPRDWTPSARRLRIWPTFGAVLRKRRGTILMTGK
ncbi:hypothetical protein PUN4_780041 [Paraburkholderia unamae]|uniref:hypothetical protein n=1 Tax=Paraburkholderia unamae TaxID=219649 RepID=UPI001CB5F605|nr:hypothetical protein [Paraburkholderia unamae]CAG9273445.1 hypothetical protein PUN4_780041 [Paraburkholderia unamae]